MFPQSKTTRVITTIFFDMNGTLRSRIPERRWQEESFNLLKELLEQPDALPVLVEELTWRYKACTQWMNENGVSLPEADIWSRWIAPDMPVERIGPRAPELLLALRNCKGRPTLKPEAATVISELHRRGYRLGIISNTTSSLDLLQFIRENGLEEYFETVVLSATCGHRKPSPEIFLEAACRLGLAPAGCAYVGNNFANDVIGSRNAGFGMTIFIDSGTIKMLSQNHFSKPDALLHSLKDLLDLFQPWMP